MNDIKYQIVEANQEQRKYVYERVTFKAEQQRDKSIIFVAVTDDNMIIGRVVVIPLEACIPFYGTRWNIYNVLVHDDFRRIGIGTALVDVIKQKAKDKNVIHLHGSANATLEASMFWLHQGFSMIKYGKKIDDESIPLWHGNYYHMINYRMAERKQIEVIKNCITVNEARKEQINGLIDDYLSRERITEYQRAYWENNRNSVLGYIATDINGDITGYIIILPDDMGAPLDEKIYWIFVYVKEEHRRRGIGTALVKAALYNANDNHIIQLQSPYKNEDFVLFWDSLGFDVFFWGKNTETGRRTITATFRVR